MSTRYTSFWLPVGQSGAASSPMRLTSGGTVRVRISWQPRPSRL
jgi:hypothetical protein